MDFMNQESARLCQEDQKISLSLQKKIKRKKWRK